MMTNNITYKQAIKKMLTASDDDCQHFFVENKYILEYAYWELLHNSPKTAQKLFSEIIDKDIRAHWGNFISSLVQGKITDTPSYFELRNFLEIDLNLFLTYYLGEYIENTIKYADWLFTINPEVHKFIGRVFIKNNYDEYGMYYLQKARNYFFNDPELHYIIAEVYFKYRDFKNAQIAIDNCLQVLPGYYPAIALQKKLQTNC